MSTSSADLGRSGGHGKHRKQGYRPEDDQPLDAVVDALAPLARELVAVRGLMTELVSEARRANELLAELNRSQWS